MNQTTWAKKIFAVTLFVEDLEACKAFYQKIFDLPPSFEDPHSAVFKFGNLIINLLNVKEAPELINPASVAAADAGSRFVISIPVDDVDAVCERLRTRGIKLLNGPMDRPWGPRTASFKDPAGYIWEIAN
ncbi:MAG: VOC family protein [Deinococcales bacterium]